MLLKAENILLYDVEVLFEKARKSAYLGLKKKETDDLLRSIKPLKVTTTGSELEFLDLRVLDLFIKNTIRDMVNYLQDKNIIKTKEELIRPLDGYFIFDETIFMGIDIVKPALFFGADSVLYPKGRQRKTQALVKYPEAIADHIRKGRQFSYLETVEEDVIFTPDLEASIYFNNFFSITNSKSKKTSYFGVWE